MEAGESNYRSLLKTRKLLKIRDAQHARNAEKAVRMYTACTRSLEERVAFVSLRNVGGSNLQISLSLLPK
jgi:plasmid stability protein